MTKRKADIPPLTEAEEARIQVQIANDPDAPELTDEQAATGRPFAEAFPGLLESWKRRPGRPKAEVTKVPLKLRLDPDVVEGYRATGPGWQTRMNDVLRHGLPTQETPPKSEPLPARLVKVNTYAVRSADTGRYLDRPAKPVRKKPKAESA